MPLLSMAKRLRFCSSEIHITENAPARTRVVTSIAWPLVERVCSQASAGVMPAAMPARKLAIKWMVSSTTTPIISVPTIIVSISSAMPSTDTSISTSKTGITLGSMDNTPSLMLRKKSTSKAAIASMDSIKLLNAPDIITSSVSLNMGMNPVIVTDWNAGLSAVASRNRRTGVACSIDQIREAPTVTLT